MKVIKSSEGQKSFSLQLLWLHPKKRPCYKRLKSDLLATSEETELPQPMRTRFAKNVSIHYTSWLVFVAMVTV